MDAANKLREDRLVFWGEVRDGNIRAVEIDYFDVAGQAALGSRVSSALTKRISLVVVTHAKKLEQNSTRDGTSLECLIILRRFRRHPLNCIAQMVEAIGQIRAEQARSLLRR